MADDAKAKPTLDGRVPAAEPAPATAPGTMQLPRGMIPDGAAAPLLPTMLPSTSAPVPVVAPPAMPSEGRYELLTEIARGGMGRVVEAHDTVLGRTVALKEALSVDPEVVRRFQRETRITARLEHPSIVPVHDAGFSPNGAPFYVMRKVSGRPLEQLVATADRLEERLALVPHIVGAAQAVAHAHERGIIHRDIKPSNILVGDLGETIVIDWGLAKAIGEPDDPHAADPLTVEPDHDDPLKTRAGIVFGTPGFMSPEQLRGRPPDERCDVYALGASLYHLLARRPPHHSKNVEEMMRTAVAGPPKPLREIVPGVPPELATIVDKALAHDVTQRYQNAGALAEDLQRFLTGQLVASHHYSRRERLVRFVRKNRVPVGIAVAAVIALAVGGTIAFLRVVHERDRADEKTREALKEKLDAERRKEEVQEKNHELTLSDARHKAEEEPTRAAAMVKPLVTTLLWRKARDVAAAARTNGVAFSLPGSRHTTSLELSRDGQRALAAGDDGVVRIHDLAHRTSRVVIDAKGAVTARFADGERRIVLFQGNQLAIVDATSGARRDVTATTAISKLEVSGPIAYWVDPASAVWRLDLAGGPPAKIPVAEPVRAVMPSPDGRWIALAGSTHLLLLDRTNPSLPPETAAEGETRDVAWASDASHLVALIGQEVIDVAMVPSPTVVHRQTVGNRFAVAYSEGRVATAGPTGVAIVARDEARQRKIPGDYTLGLREARGGVIVSAGPQGVIAVLSDDGDEILRSPVGRTSLLAAASTSPWVLVAVDDRVLVWNLDAIQPLRATAGAPSGARFVTGDQVIATFADAPAQWIDLRTGKALALGQLAAITNAVPAPDGMRALVIDVTHHARIVGVTGEAEDLEGDITDAAFVDDRRLVVASGGTVRLEQGPKLSTQMFTHPGMVTSLATTADDRGWVAAAYGDGFLWRLGFRGTDGTLETHAKIDRDALVLGADGTAVFGAGAELRAWHPDGTAETLATFGRPIVAVALAAPDTAFVLTAEGSAFFASLRHPDKPGPALDMTAGASLATGAALASSLTPAGVLEVVDPTAQERWTLAKGPQFAFTQISPDATRVLAVTPTALLVWTLALPPAQDDTGPWLDAMTNATAEDPAQDLRWP